MECLKCQFWLGTLGWKSQRLLTLPICNGRALPVRSISRSQGLILLKNKIKFNPILHIHTYTHTEKKRKKRRFNFVRYLIQFNGWNMIIPRPRGSKPKSPGRLPSSHGGGVLPGNQRGRSGSATAHTGTVRTAAGFVYFLTDRSFFPVRKEAFVVLTTDPLLWEL